MWRVGAWLQVLDDMRSKRQLEQQTDDKRARNIYTGSQSIGSFQHFTNLDFWEMQRWADNRPINEASY